MTKLNNVLLIDDSETDNFIHRRRLERMGIAGTVTVRNNGREGLDYLTTPLPDGAYPHPDLLFLDINMPLLDGWGFLDAYQQLPNDQRARVTVVLITSSIHERDTERAAAYAVIDERMSKPLTIADIERLLGRYFPAMATATNRR
jgi:CheY-like chemotaxis protein